MIAFGVLLIVVGVLIFAGAVKQGMKEDLKTKVNVTLYDLLTNMGSLGFYTILLGLIFLFM